MLSFSNRLTFRQNVAFTVILVGGEGFLVVKTSRNGDGRRDEQQQTGQRLGFRNDSESSSVANVLARSGLLEGVSPDAAATLISQLRQVWFPRRHTIFVEGQAGDDLYIIVTGKVTIRVTALHGREMIIALLGPTDIFGDLAVFDPAPRSSTVATVTEVHAVMLDRNAVQAWVCTHPEVVDVLLRVLTRRLKRTHDNLFDLTYCDVPSRVAKKLLDLAMRFGTCYHDALGVNHQLTQEELAALVGSSRETINKTLSDFTQRGWIQQCRNTLFINEPGQLARLAGHRHNGFMPALRSM